jgi:hypothetical protein
MITGLQVSINGFFHENLMKCSVVEECLRSFLPEKLREGAPTGFSMIGHIGMTTCTPCFISRTYPIKAHVNLNDEYLPYKHIIGQLIIDVGNFVVSSELYSHCWTEKQKGEDCCEQAEHH